MSDRLKIRGERHRRAKMKSTYADAVLVVFALFATSTVHAEQNAGLTATAGFTPSPVTPGSPAGSYILSGFDTVNLGNLHVNFRFPLLKIGGNGRGSASVVVSPDMNRYWQAVITAQAISPCGPNGCQFTYYYTVNNTNWQPVAFIPGVPRLVERPAGSQCQHINNTGVWLQTLTRLTATSTDGTETEFVDSNTGGLVKPGTAATNGSNRGSTFVSRDGSSSMVTTTAPVSDIGSSGLSCRIGNVPISGTLVTRDGVQYTFVNGYASQITDRNGNTISYSNVASNTGATITDPAGRKYQITGGSQLTGISWTGFNGTPRAVAVKYDYLHNLFRKKSGVAEFSVETTGQLWPQLTQCASSPAQCPAASTGQTIDPQLISEIDLPDGSAYTFSYNSYGDVAQVTLPTGGAVQYDYVPNPGTPNDLVHPTTPADKFHRCQSDSDHL